MPIGINKVSRNSQIGTAIPDGGLQHEYDAREETYVDQSTGDSFSDIKGSNNLSAVNTPVYNSDGINAQAAFDYQPADGDSHKGASPWQAGTNNEFTLAILYNARDNSNDDVGLVSTHDEGNGIDIRLEWSSNQYEVVFHGGDGIETGGTPSTSTEIAILAYDGQDYYFEVDDSDIFGPITAGYSSSSSGAATVGDVQNDYDGLVGHALYYNIFYNDEGRTNIHDGIRASWNL